MLVPEAGGEERHMGHEILVVNDPVTSLRARGGRDLITKCLVAHARTAERVQTRRRISQIRERESRERSAEAMPGDGNVLSRVVLAVCSHELFDVPPGRLKVTLKSLMHARPMIVDQKRIRVRRDVVGIVFLSAAKREYTALVISGEKSWQCRRCRQNNRRTC